MHKCETCGAEFYYSPGNHRCEGEWESMTTPLAPSKYEGMSWDEECVAKVMDR